MGIKSKLHSSERALEVWLDAFIVAKDFIGNDKVSLILGDNIFHGNMRLSEVFSNFKTGALIFGYPVSDPERYGILELNSKSEVVGIEEKPKPKSRYAVPGLYLYDNRVVSFSEQLSPCIVENLKLQI